MTIGTWLLAVGSSVLITVPLTLLATRGLRRHLVYKIAARDDEIADLQKQNVRLARAAAERNHLGR